METKHLLGILGVLLLVSLLVNISYAIDPKTIIGQWSLDEGAGKVTKDSSVGENDGSLAGNPKWVDGKLGKALSFNGQNDCVQIPFKEPVPDKYTLSVWIYQEDTAVSPGDDGDYGQTILSSSSAANNYAFWLLSHKGGAIRFYSFETESPNANSLLTKPGAISLKKWYHIAATAVKGGDSVIYVDGVEKARWKNKGKATTTVSFYIGDLRVDRKIAFNGIIDEVTIYNVVLSQEDINRLASGGMAVSPSGKLATVWGRIKNQ